MDRYVTDFTSLVDRYDNVDPNIHKIFITIYDCYKHFTFLHDVRVYDGN